MTNTTDFRALAIVALIALVAGCSSGDGAIEVSSTSTPLTDGGNDALFTIKVVDAPADGYALEGVVVKALPDGKDAITLACTPTDVNKNAKLDAGDTLACAEGATNQLGADAAGAEITIELRARAGEEETLVGEATWTPPAK
jgi:hypothetical protein